MQRLTFILVILFFSCGPKKEQKETLPERVVSVPLFNPDSAFVFTSRQVTFGPRIPNTPAHRATSEFLVAKFKEFGATVKTQDFDATTWDGEKLSLKNIIASYFPEKQKRILLAAHWDTRPYADKDKQNPAGKLDGANDGASGVAVLLEIARQLGKANPPQVGVDIILFDGEDWGKKEGMDDKVNPPPQGLDSWWCLGSQYWSKHKHAAGYTAFYGILLDMVGGKDAHFFQEGNSMEFAPRINEKVWNTASRLGHSSVFVRQQGMSIEDDHYHINKVAKIPMIDIIPYDPVTKDFGSFHHTQMDNMSIISKETLGIVGKVVMTVLYYED